MATSQPLMPALAQEAKTCLPSRPHDRSWIEPTFFWTARTSSPVAASHTRTHSSSEQAASRRPSGL
ncbi:MAG: hypothetical protein U0797_17225 [Gemmataceae bacterium]